MKPFPYFILSNSLVEQYQPLPDHQFNLQYKNYTMLPSCSDEPSSVVSNRRNHIKKQIRRQEIQNYFDERRKELLRNSEVDSKQMMQKLKSNEQKQQFLSNVMKMLEQQPSQNWRAVIKQLRLSLSCFDGNFQVWINFRIVDKLASIMHERYVELDLQEEVAGLFAEMINFTTVKKNNSYFMAIPVVQDVIILLRNNHIPASKRGPFFHFLANLCLLSYQIRNFIIEQGAGELLIEYGSILLSQLELMEENFLYNYSGYCSQFLNIFRIKDNNHLPDFSFAASLTPVIIGVLATKKSQRLSKVSLTCLQLILKGKKVIIQAKFMSNDSLINILFDLTQTCDWSIKAKALNVINILISSSQDYSWINKIWAKDLIGLLYTLNNNTNATSMVRQLSVNIFTNFITSTAMAEAFITHPIFELIISYLIKSSDNIRQQAYFCLQSVFTELTAKSIDLIIKKYPLLNTLTTQIKDWKINRPQIVIKSLQIIEKYIQISQSPQSQFNKAVDILQRVYRFSNLLEDLAHNKNPQIVSKAESLIDVVSQCVSE